MKDIRADSLLSRSVGLSALAVGTVMVLVVVGVVLADNRLARRQPPLIAAPLSRTPPARAPSRVRPWSGRPAEPAQQVYFLRPAPAIVSGEVAPHIPRGACRGCHRIRRRQSTVNRALPMLPIFARGKRKRVGPASALKALPFQEAHWQGLELVALAKANARLIKAPRRAKGVVVDEATTPADMQGFLAGDLIVTVGGLPTVDLASFVEAARKARDRRTVQIRLIRKGETKTLFLTALRGVLGDANGETAPMIPANSRSPHAYIGPCTSCHRIGVVGNLPVDRGDPAPASTHAPTIRAGQQRPHRDRGRCTACHTIL